VGHQSIYIRLPDTLARRLNLYLEDPNAGYMSIDEFAEVAIRNQLNADGAPGIQNGRNHWGRSEMSLQRERGGQTDKNLSVGVAVEGMRAIEQFQAPPPNAPLPLIAAPDSTNQRLSSLTNRLSQVKVAARVCANLSQRGEWPEMKDFQIKAANTARAIGLVLRALPGPRGGDVSGRAHIGYPTGEEVEKAQARFINSFTINLAGDKVTGPLAILGLANIIDGKVALTEAGWRFAVLPSPLTRETDQGILLSPDEAAELRARLCDAGAEVKAIREFLRDVRRSNGSQTRVDEMLNQQYPDWNQQQVIAQRAAMVGRLSDIDVLQVDGRGANAVIRLLPAAQEFNN
jgi:hypothetical protein